MPVTIVLILACIGGANATYAAVHNTATIVRAAKALHHHTTKPLYVHVLKPIGQAAE
jgi:hypothetical protein